MYMGQSQPLTDTCPLLPLPSPFFLLLLSLFYMQVGVGSQERSSQDLLLFYGMKRNLEIMALPLNRFKNSGSEVRHVVVHLPSPSVRSQ